MQSDIIAREKAMVCVCDSLVLESLLFPASRLA